MESVKVTPAAVEAFQTFYLAELDSRIQRSEVVGAITLKKGNAALFYEQESGKFTLVEKRFCRIGGVWPKRVVRLGR